MNGLLAQCLAQNWSSACVYLWTEGGCLSDFTFLGSRCWNRSRWVQGYWEVTPGTDQRMRHVWAGGDINLDDDAGLTRVSPARGGARNKACGFEDPLTGQKWPGSCAAPLPSQRPRAVGKSKPWAQTLTWILKKLQLEAVSQPPPPSRQLGPESFLDTHLWHVLQNDPILDVLWYTDINICLELILFWTSKIYHNCCRLFEYWGKLEPVLFTPVLFQGHNVIAHKKSNNNNNSNSLNVCFG